MILKCLLYRVKFSRDKVFDTELKLGSEECVCKQELTNDYTIIETRELELIEQGLTIRRKKTLGG